MHCAPEQLALVLPDGGQHGMLMPWQCIAGVTAAVKRKAANAYPTGTALVVRVDDSVPFREDADVTESE